MVAILPTMKIIPHGMLLSLRRISAPRSRLSSLRVASPPLTVTLLFSWEKTFVAELIAQVMARILILQYAHQYSITPITHPFVLYSNESAAAASSKIPKSQKSLGLLGNVLDVSCQGACTCTAHHVCGHDCHPCTDYADSICTPMRDRLTKSQILRISESQTPTGLQVPKPMSRHPNRVAMAPHGLLLGENEATPSRKPLKHLFSTLRSH